MGLFCYPWPGLLMNSGQDSHGNPTSTFLYQSYRSLRNTYVHKAVLPVMNALRPSGI